MNEKIKELKTYFAENNILVFSDLDDTITNNNDIFYTKVKLLKKWGKGNEQNYQKLLKNFQINNSFLEVCKKNKINKVYILSRNSQDFIDNFIKETGDLFEKNWLKIMWWVWVSEKLSINTKDKLKIIPGWSTIISDIFEYRELKNYDNFISVDRYSKVKYYSIILKKILYLIKFLITRD